jgi:hypothetical protein
MLDQDLLGRIADLSDRHLKPYVKRIDEEAYYPETYLRELGRQSLLPVPGMDERDSVRTGMPALLETSKRCLTTGFVLWCHLAAMTYLRNGESDELRRTLLPQLADGTLLGGTGLSNPMKFYAGLDKLYLRAERQGDGYVIHGTLPLVSNLGDNHWFGVVADAGDRRIAAFIPCTAPGLSRNEQVGFIGLNGSATYSCRFDGVPVQPDWLLTRNADEWVLRIRTTFVLYQIPLAIGLIDGCIESVRSACGRQGGCNAYQRIQASDLERDRDSLLGRLGRLVETIGEGDGSRLWPDVVQLRLDAVYAALRAAQTAMLHVGSPGYKAGSDASRRLRESYFLANLTPTVRQLEKMVATA